MQPKLLGLTGRKQSGKDTAAAVMEGEKISFAAPIKLMLQALLKYQGLDEVFIDRMLNGDLKETPSPYLADQTPRYAMQRLGTEWGRQQMADSLWVDIALEKAKKARRAVITDVRFPNEVQAIKDADGQVWRISRPGRPVGVGEEHSSEILIDTLPVDKIITNDAPSAGAFRTKMAAIVTDTQ